MGDKVILTEVLEASNLTEAYVDLTAKSLIQELRHVGDDLVVRYSNLDDRTELGEPADQRPESDDGQRTFTVDEAVEALGFGRFQIKLSILTGLAWMADAMEMMLLSLISPALACEWGISSVQQALVTTCVFSGMMLSSTFWGKICDRFGRRKGLTFSTLVACLMGALSSMSPHFYVLLLFRGLTGFGIGGVPQSVTLYAEFLPTAQRAKCVVLIESFWAIGAVFEALLAYVVMSWWGWRALMLGSSLPLGIFAALSFWLPESARFDMASGHPERAMETLQEAARQNRVQLPIGRLVSSTPAGKDNRGDLTSLLAPDLRKTTILLWIIWAVNAFSYYGMVLFTTVLFQSHDECHGGLFSNGTKLETCQPLTRSDYFDLLSTTLAEFPGLIITVVVIEWLGRKKTMALEFSVFAIFTFLLYFCLDRFTVTVFIFVARAFISGAFQCAYVYTPEVYPTTLRAVGLGTSSAMARIGAIATPFVAQVASETSLSLPIGIYGTAAVVGLISAVSLPIETKGRTSSRGKAGLEWILSCSSFSRSTWASRICIFAYSRHGQQCYGCTQRWKKMERKDIEDFLRRSNSICDHEVESDEPITVRRMSLAEFTGLAPKQKIFDIEVPTWRSSVSQSSLLNSFSARRRSVLSTDVCDSPSRRLTPQKEESLDLATAIDRLSSLRERTSNLERAEGALDGVEIAKERDRANEAIGRLALVSRDISGSANETVRKGSTLIGEATEAAELLFAAVEPLIVHSPVFLSELIATEASQVFRSLAEFLCSFRDDSPATSAATAHVTSSLNVLNRALASLDQR
ncbi:unnamed protein product [Caenorhabditis auriculariae]|uniref:Major facilitator superfamily (MFS) profile domain-containing protein n=1 Tax=Caenorhabditis auriculariae TaxID=2777116 RepID=A0A8S1HPJ8_9PELO|nr:unnamed protein product [Caenorhabditis auriculariae]